MAKSDIKKARTRERQERLLRMFDGDGYEEFVTPNYVFVKHWNGDNKTWQVAIYTRESFRRYKNEHVRNLGTQMER
jgi:hypothetical protein